jgi:hypothetical protein
MEAKAIFPHPDQFSGYCQVTAAQKTPYLLSFKRRTGQNRPKPEKGRTDLVADILENETDFPIPLICHSQLGPVSNNSKTGYIFRLGRAKLQPSKALKHSRSLPVHAAQKLHFEPVKDRWGIRELF